MDKYLISAKIAIFLQITTFTLSNDVNLFFPELLRAYFLKMKNTARTRHTNPTT